MFWIWLVLIPIGNTLWVWSNWTAKCAPNEKLVFYELSCMSWIIKNVLVCNLQLPSREEHPCSSTTCMMNLSMWTPSLMSLLCCRRSALRLMMASTATPPTCSAIWSLRWRDSILARWCRSTPLSTEAESAPTWEESKCEITHYRFLIVVVVIVSL